MICPLWSLTFPTSVSDLTNTTWKLNQFFDQPYYSPLDAPQIFEINFNIVNDSTRGEGRRISLKTDEAFYTYTYGDNNIATVDIDSPNPNYPWRDRYDVLSTIYITGGQDVQNVDLITWLQANATQIIE